MQDRLTIQPQGIYIDNVPGIGRYYLNTLYENRELRDSFSVHLGGEYEAVKKRLLVRLGWMIETSATPDETASVLAPDGLHNVIALGLSVYVWKFRLDLGYSHIFTNERTVDYRRSNSLQLNPIQPGIAVPVTGGTYRVSADVLALGFDGRF
jgi:long-subunit fatty acid transport protein